MKLIPHHLNAGLFSQINFVMTHIEALGHAEFYVDWTGNTLYEKADRNLFDDSICLSRIDFMTIRPLF